MAQATMAHKANEPVTSLVCMRRPTQIAPAIEPTAELFELVADQMSNQTSAAIDYHLASEWLANWWR